MDLMLTYMREIREEAKRHHVPVTDTMNIYLGAYMTHRERHGSYKSIVHESHYMQKMHERYRFMRQTALEFIAQQVEERRREVKHDE